MRATAPATIFCAVSFGSVGSTVNTRFSPNCFNDVTAFSVPTKQEVVSRCVHGREHDGVVNFLEDREGS